MWRETLRRFRTAVPAAGRLPRPLLAAGAVGAALCGAAVAEIGRRGGTGDEAPHWTAWLLLALGGVGLAIASGPARAAPVASPRGLSTTPRGARSARRALFVSVVACGASVPLFLRLNTHVAGDRPRWLENTASWLLYALSLAAFLVALAVWHRRASRGDDGIRAAGDQLPRRIELAVIAGLLALALLLRLPDLGDTPPGLWFDEAEEGLVAQRLLEGGAIHQTFVPSQYTQMGALYFYVLGAVIEIAGASIVALRLLPALAGALTVPIVYLLGARLYGWRTGLAAAGLLAVSVWSITFSRIGMNSMPTVALDVGVYLCIVQGLRTGKLSWYGLGGVLLGIALQGYQTAQSVPLVLLALVACLFLTERRTISRLVPGAAVFALGAVLAFMPVGLYVLQQPESYTERADEVSVFSQHEGSLGDALAGNLRRHLMMFNYRGDRNARHNLPGEPMLDWLTAAAFFGGLAICLTRLRHWQYAFPVIWFLVVLSAGVLTLPYEAPQGARTLENCVVTALMAGIFIGEAAGVVARMRSRPRLALAVAAAIPVAAVVVAGGMNADRYFWHQRIDPRVWLEMNGTEKEVGLLLERYDATHDVQVDPLYFGRPASAYLAPDARPTEWRGMHTLPLGGERPALVILEPRSARGLSYLTAMYPEAQVSVVRPPSYEEPAMYSVRVPARDLRAVRGVQATIRDRGRSRTLALRQFRTPRFRRTRPGATLSLEAIMRITHYGRHAFRWASDGGASAPVRVDGRVVSPADDLRLPVGLHRVTVGPLPVNVNGSGRLLISMRPGVWRPAPPAAMFDPDRIEPSGLVGYYRSGRGFRRPVAFARVDPTISFYFHRIPLPLPFTVEWTGEVFAPTAGRYRFGTQQFDTARLAIDRRVLVENRLRDTYAEGAMDLTSGWHTLRLQYTAESGDSQIFLYWTPPQGRRAIIPSHFLRADSG
jgi:hypothetical protein